MAKDIITLFPGRVLCNFEPCQSDHALFQIHVTKITIQNRMVRLEQDTNQGTYCIYRTVPSFHCRQGTIPEPFILIKMTITANDSIFIVIIDNIADGASSSPPPVSDNPHSSPHNNLTQLLQTACASITARTLESNLQNWM